MNRNLLTNAELERLAHLSEEAAEVIQIINKIIRHGYASAHPDNDTILNRTLLAREIGDFFGLADKLVEQEDVDIKTIEEYRLSKWERSAKYWHYQL